MLAFLVMASMFAWIASFRTVERTPRAQQMSAQIVSIVTITRAALTHSAPEKRRELLFDLASNEGVRIYLREEGDTIIAPEETPFFLELKALTKQKLGTQTHFAQNMNGVNGFWISFDMEEDQYWLRLEQERLEQPMGLQLLSWVSATLLLTLLGAVVISKLVNDPLSRLSNAARQIAKGKYPQALPEIGPKEIRETNASFNRMMEDLNRIEADRSVILAGISHDLRTPLARMQLEVEMANLSPESREGMQSDLHQMDEIIGQFLDYAKPIDSIQLESVNVSDLLLQVIQEFSRLPHLQIRSNIAPDHLIQGNSTELRRLFNNLIENACRYGKTAGEDKTIIDIQCGHKQRSKKQDLLISFRDYGQGVPPQDISRLLRPFTRADVSRSQANGSGLGLAIVDRIVKRHDGKLRIYNHTDGGFVVVIAFPEMKQQ